MIELWVFLLTIFLTVTVSLGLQRRSKKQDKLFFDSPPVVWLRSDNGYAYGNLFVIQDEEKASMVRVNREGLANLHHALEALRYDDVKGQRGIELEINTPGMSETIFVPRRVIPHLKCVVASLHQETKAKKSLRQLEDEDDEI